MSDHIFEYNNTAVHYEQLGKGKPLIFLHGWGVDRSVMKPLARQLAHARTCYLVDLPGFGNSPAPPAAWDVSSYADMIEQFINSLFDEPVELLVHSFGGRIALKLCARQEMKSHIGKVLITGGAGMKPKRSMTFYFKKYLGKCLKAPFNLLPERPRKASLQKLRQTKLWNWLGSSGYKKLDGVMRNIFVLAVTEYLEQCLPHIDNEVLLLWGANDEATPLYQAERMEKGLKNGALVVVKNAGHYAFLDRPGRFTTIAKAFFEE